MPDKARPLPDTTAGALMTTPSPANFYDILAVHREHDGYIAFARKLPPGAPPEYYADGRPKNFQHLASIQVRELRQMLPGFAEFLYRDSYYSVNAYFRPARRKNEITGLPDVTRKDKHLRWLTACYADIDCGRLPADSKHPNETMLFREAQNRAQALADAGIIPQPSIIARSGRGAYLLWLLADHTGKEIHPRAYPEKRLLYKELNKELGRRLLAAEIPVDIKAHDTTRVLRLPGSVHTGAGRRVVYYIIQAGADGRGFLYTLPELENFLGLPATPKIPAITEENARPANHRRTINIGTRPNRANGPRQLNSLRAHDLRKLERHRGGFLKRGTAYPDGSISPGRCYSLTLYARFLRGSGATYRDTLDALRDLAARCGPPYPSDANDTPLNDIVRAAFQKTQLFRNNYLCRRFSITPELARSLELETILPPEVAAERHQARPLYQDKIKARRAFAFEQYHARHGNLSARQLARLYQENNLPGANRQTANADLKALFPWRTGLPRLPEPPGAALDFTPGDDEKDATR